MNEFATAEQIRALAAARRTAKITRLAVAVSALALIATIVNALIGA